MDTRHPSSVGDAGHPSSLCGIALFYPFHSRNLSAVGVNWVVRGLLHSKISAVAFFLVSRRSMIVVAGAGPNPIALRAVELQVCTVSSICAGTHGAHTQ